VAATYSFSSLTCTLRDMKPVFDIPPRTIMEVYKNLPEGTLAELIDNVLYMPPSPVKSHQKALQIIFRRLSEAIEDVGNGEVIIAPFDVYLDATSNAVQPDIVVILNSNKGHSIPNGHFHGVPDLIVEILSPGNRDHDVVKKKELYERFGVSEYWIVDPESKEAIGYFLQDSKFISLGSEKGNIPFKLLKLAISF
jgi:Uma2 family endonuclease